MVLVNVKSQIAERDAEIESLRSRLREAEAQAGAMRAALEGAKLALLVLCDTLGSSGLSGSDTVDQILAEIDKALSTTLGADVSSVIEAARDVVAGRAVRLTILQRALAKLDGKEG